jgi:hypothetical protein
MARRERPSVEVPKGNRRGRAILESPGSTAVSPTSACLRYGLRRAVRRTPSGHFMTYLRSAAAGSSSGKVEGRTVFATVPAAAEGAASRT